MVKVECDGCGAPYSVAENRIPAGGLKMRCPKCGSSFLVAKPDAGPPAVRGVDLDLPTMRPQQQAAAAAAAPADEEPRTSPTNELAQALSDAGGLESLLDDLGTAGAAAPPARRNGPTLRSAVSVRDEALDPAWRSRKPPQVEIQTAADAGYDDLPATLARPAAKPGPAGGPGGVEDLPAVAVPPGPAAGRSQPEPDDGFGVLDLPLPSSEAQTGRGDLPALKRPGARVPGDLPARKAAGAPGPGDLPDVHQRGDLPAVRPAGDLPDVHGPGHLPDVHAGTGLPNLRRSAPQAGLADPDADLPGMPAAVAAGARAAAQEEEDLPGLPTGEEAPAKAFPSLAPAGEPAPGEGGEGVAQELLGPADDTSAGSGLPAEEGDFGLPSGADASAGTGFGVEDFGALDDVGLEGEEPADSFAGAAAGVGGEFALDTGGEPVALAPSLLRGAGELAEEDKEEEDRTKLIRRRKRRILVAFVSAPVLIFAMAFIPLVLGGGPFGWHWITDTLNRSRYESELDAFRTSAQAGLGTDTRAAAERAFEGAKALQIDMPRFAPMAAYTALVGYMMSLRFGPDSAREAFAKDVLESLGAREPSELCTLATAAQAAVEGKLARARQAAAALSRRLPKDVDAAVLSAEVALGAKETAPALELWRAAVKLDGSARSLYGLARAELAAGNPDQAIKTARRALEKSKLHAGARTLIAAVLWEKRADEEAAIKLLKEVTAKGAVREAASKSELVAAHSQLGEILLSFSRYSDAEEAFKEAMKLDPQAERALCGNGELYYQQGRFAEALGRFDAAVRANPDSIDARVGIAKTYLSTERAKDARNLMQKTEAAAAKAKDPLVGYWQGRAEETLGNKKEAEAAYRRAIEVGGTDVRTVQAYVALANLLAGLGRAEEAARVLADATEKLPKSAALHNARGDIALRAGQFDEARKQFEQALALDPKNLASRFKLAVTLRRLQEYEQAQQMLEDLSKRDPSYPGLAIELGSLYADTGQTERAMAMINEALVRAPDDPDAKLRLAQLLVQQNNAGLAKRAETLLREVQKVRPQSAEVAHFLGRALLLQRTNLADALGLLEFATGRDENRAEYWLYYGWAAIDANQYDVAAKALDRALRLDRNLGDAFWLRGKLRHLLGASVDALRDLETALEKNPSRYEAYATMAFCYTAEIDHPKAQAAWRKAIEGNDQVAEWHYRLGKSLWQQGNRAAATPELVRAVELTDQAQAAGESIELARNWLFDANYLLYDAYKSADKVKAVQHARRYLSLAPRDHAYLQEVDRFLKDNDEIQ